MATKKTKTVNPALTLNDEDVKILHEVLQDYKGFVEYTYKNNLMIIAQGEQMLKTSNDKDKTIELIKAIDKYKEQSSMLDVARLRADSVHIKVKDFLGIKDEDETTSDEWAGELQDGDTADKSDAEVSEGAEVLPEEG